MEIKPYLEFAEIAVSCVDMFLDQGFRHYVTEDSTLIGFTPSVDDELQNLKNR